MWVVKTMGNRAEELRRQAIAGGGALARHSMNQETTGYIIQMQERGFDRKAARARQKRNLLEDQERGLELLGERREFQFDRALGNTFNGMPIEDVMDLAPENIAYVFKHIGKHGCTIETFNTEKGTKVSVTIVEFTRPVV